MDPKDKGTLAVSVNATNAVTEGWSVTYEAGNDRWVVGGDAGGVGVLTKQQDGSWQGSATAGMAGPTRLTLTVTHTAGKENFDDGDEFKLSTFKSTAAGGKENKIGPGSFDVTGGP